MTKFLTAAALLVAIAPVAAYAEEAPTRSFTRDGQTYVYTSTEKGNATVLSGRAYPSGRSFELTVRGDKVRGYASGVPVSFTTKDAAGSSSKLSLR